MKKLKYLLFIISLMVLSSCVTSKNQVAISDYDNPDSIYEKVYH
ncbi:hypothetical protein [Flammeovirga pacifica]|nr:hypothetical protein [Flammeovirga pacifica]